MALSTRDKRALYFGGAALALIGLYFGVIEPTYHAYSDLAGRHESAANRLAAARREQQKNAYAEERIKEWESKAGLLTPPKLYGEAITSVGSQIIAAAQSSNVELAASTPAAATPWPEDSQLEQALINIDAQAEWENVFKFISALYRIEGVLSVEQMDLGTVEPKRDNKLKLRLAVSILLQAAPNRGGRWAR